jgi:PST family polysaccharide transporter
MDYETTNLTSKVIIGAKWSTISQVARQMLQLLNKIILANLLAPAAFGLLGMAIVVIGFLQIFKDIGTTSAIIQRKHVTSSLLSSIFWMNILLGIVITGVLIAIAPLIAVFFDEPAVTLVLRVLSLSFLFASLSVVQQALLMRQMAFKTLTHVEVASVFVATVVGIGLAIAGAGVWSLVAASLASAAVLTILLWMSSSWRPQFSLNWQDIRSIASYSLNLSGFNVSNYFIRNADNLLVGRYLGATSLGFYSMAYSIMLYPLQNISYVLGRVLFSALARLQEEHARYRRAYLRLCATIAAITFPLMLGLFVTADLLIGVLLGEKWLPVASLLIILAPVGMIQSVGATTGQIYATQGRTDLQFRWAIVKGIFIIGAFAVGLRWGIMGVAIAYT